MSDTPYRLSFAAVIITALSVLRLSIVPIAITIFFNFREILASDAIVSVLVITLIVAGSLLLLFIVLGIGLAKWWTFYYWFEDGELRVKHGIFVKKKRYIPFERIQTLNYKEGIIHRIFGLVRVEVETANASGGEPEVVFTALTKAAANQIEIEMKKVKNQMVATEEDTELAEIEITPVVYRMTLKDLIILATTSGSMGVVISGVFAIGTQISDIIPYEKIYGELANFARYGVLVISIMIVAVFIVSWLVSIILTFVRYYNFTVIIEDEKIVITRGLLEKKRVTIPLNRVQAIKLIENPLRQPFGYGSVSIESAGSNEGEEVAYIFPLIKRKEANALLMELFPNYIWDATLQSVPKRARPFYYRMDFFWLVPVIVVVSYYFMPWGLLSILLVPLVMLLGTWQYRTSAYGVYDKQLILRYRIFSRVTFYVKRHRIQAMTTRSTYFKKRKDVLDVDVRVMSGTTGTGAKIIAMERTDAEQILQWYEKK